MQGSQASTTAKDANMEFTIYTFQRGEGKEKSLQRWHKLETHKSMNDAVSKADQLYATGKFSKIEIKQKYVDPKKGRVIDVTLKTYQTKEKATVGAGLLTLLAASCGLVAFVIAYYFGHQ